MSKEFDCPLAHKDKVDREMLNVYAGHDMPQSLAALCYYARLKFNLRTYSRLLRDK